MNNQERSSNITMSNLGNFTIKNYDKQIQNNISLHNNLNQELNYKDRELRKKRYLEMNQEKAILNKNELLLTRTRMLQISNDKMSYKKKIIYMLITIIFIIFIVLIYLTFMYR
jgi:ABC-type multidrug transport system permease subunit